MNEERIKLLTNIEKNIQEIEKAGYEIKSSIYKINNLFFAEKYLSDINEIDEGMTVNGRV